MYLFEVKPEADTIFKKLLKKNRKQLEIINKKITFLRHNPFHSYKFLRKPLQSFNRVHIDKHFVLIFRINHDDRAVEVHYSDHHDNVYNWKPQLVISAACTAFQHLQWNQPASDLCHPSALPPSGTLAHSLSCRSGSSGFPHS